MPRVHHWVNFPMLVYIPHTKSGPMSTLTQRRENTWSMRTLFDCSLGRLQMNANYQDHPNKCESCHFRWLLCSCDNRKPQNSPSHVKAWMCNKQSWTKSEKHANALMIKWCWYFSITHIFQTDPQEDFRLIASLLANRAPT